MNVYAFRSNRTIANVNPQVAGEELERIRAQQGELTPANVLEAAAPEDSPLHAAFEWDDSAAAQQHRLAQARRLVTSIRVLNSPTANPVTAYVSVRTPDKGRSYLPTLQAMSDEELRVRVLQEIRQALEGIERRYAHFTEVAALVEGLKKHVG